MPKIRGTRKKVIYIDTDKNPSSSHLIQFSPAYYRQSRSLFCVLPMIVFICLEQSTLIGVFGVPRQQEGTPYKPDSGNSNQNSMDTRHQDVPIGKLFLLRLPPPARPGILPQGILIDSEHFPSWCRYNQTAMEIYGIPQQKNVGRHSIKVGSTKMKVDVIEGESTELCPEEHLIFLEILGKQRLSALMPPEQVHELKAIHEILTNSGIPGVELTDWRLFAHNWLEKYRTVTKRISDEFTPLADDQTVFVLRIACGELDALATDIINTIAESGQNFQVVEAVLRVKPNHTRNSQSELNLSKGVETDNKLQSFAPWISVVLVLIVLISIVVWWLRFRRPKTITHNHHGEKKLSSGTEEMNGESKAMISSK